MKAIDKAMCWVEEHTNPFITIMFGIVWSSVIYLSYLVLTKQ